ncbi:putative LOB domain-containing protein 6-like isoform X1 [Capsicum annuum]|nr:putative LOB domain-containing protein 6-like isoform X1 [Capsicum annuum]
MARRNPWYQLSNPPRMNYTYTNYTYHFQGKDQISSYYYNPTTSLHRAACGYGPLIMIDRELILLLFDKLEDDEVDGGDKISLAPVVTNGTWKSFMEFVIENTGKSVQSWHMSGYAFFCIIETERWSPKKRKNYNLLDAVSRDTIQVYLNSFTVIMTALDNAGLWNIRSNSLERHYLDNNMMYSSLTDTVGS